MHAGPYALTLWIPWYGSFAPGRLNLRLSAIQILPESDFRKTRPEVDDTHGSFVSGMHEGSSGFRP